jgi:hypothetical protein
MAQMFFDERYSLIIDPDEVDAKGNKKKHLMPSDEFIESVKTIVNKIAKARVGNAVLHTIKVWKFYVKIAPYDADDSISIFSNVKQSKDDCGPDGGAKTDFGTAEDLAAYKNHKYERGVKTMIRFTPGLFAAGGACQKRYGNRDISDFVPTADQVLLHELAHATRYTSMTAQWGGGETMGDTGLRAFQNEEEFDAVLVETMYQSELKGNMRWGHHSFLNMSDELKDSFEFYKASKKMFHAVDKFCSMNPHLTHRLAALKVPFNPIAAYFRDKKRCEANSKSIAAARADNILVSMLQWLTPGFPPSTWDKLL